MDSAVSGEVANVFLDSCEALLVSNLRKRGLVAYLRYVDDIVCVFKNSIDADLVIGEFGSYMKPLQIKKEFCNVKVIDFLDFSMNISKNETQFSVFRKSTDTGITINWKDFAPKTMEDKYPKMVCPQGSDTFQ